MSAPQPFDYVAYQLAHQGYGIGHGEAQKRLHEQFAEKTEEEILDMYGRARALYETAFDLCTQFYDKRLPEQQVAPRVRQACPGFSDVTYHRALGDCFHEAMW
jgi:hypothetical protein